MNASKENARKSKEAISRLEAASSSAIMAGHAFFIEDCTTLRNFLEAAERKLPTEAAFTRAAGNRKAGAKKSRERAKQRKAGV